MSIVNTGADPRFCLGRGAGHKVRPGGVQPSESKENNFVLGIFKIRGQSWTVMDSRKRRLWKINIDVIHTGMCR